MAGFDLNNQLDFAKATLSDVGNVLNQFGNGGLGEWDLKEAAYNGVVFHVITSQRPYQAALSRIQDEGGRRLVKYMFPYTDGQTTDDLGRMPETITMNVLFHGERYLQGFEDLLRELQKPEPGTLIHPVFGERTVKLENLQNVHEHSARRAIACSITFVEHNFTIGAFESDRSPTAKSAIAALLEGFALLDEALTRVQAAVIFASSVKAAVVALITNFQDRYLDTSQGLNRTFNSGNSSDLPTLLPVETGGTDSDEFPGAIAPSDPFNSVPISTSTATGALTIEQLQQSVNDRRAELAAIIASIINGAPDAALEFHDTIVDLRCIANFLQDALERGAESSRGKIVDYVTPWDMSIREVAFQNGISVEEIDRIDQLNPSLLSVNLIVKGTTIKVPVES